MATSVLQILPNYDQEFSKLCKTSVVREWFEQQLERYGARKLRVHYVIGLQTIRDASLTLKDNGGAMAEAKGSIPLAQLLGDPGVLSGLLNPSVAASVQTANISSQKFSVAEAVYGVKYGVVRFEYHCSRALARVLGRADLGTARLATDTRWVVTGADAAGESGEEGDSLEVFDDVEDMIEAHLYVEDDAQ
jgi:hypothetical protein